MIVDCHAHMLPQPRMGKLIQWARRSNPAHPVPEDVGIDALLREYAQAGIMPMKYGRIISLSSCSTMWQCQTKSPGTLKVALTRVISSG